MKAERIPSMTWRLAALALLTLGTGTALAAQRPVVVQLFTSLGCSDCPPADALLARISAQDPGVLVLDLHVTYWNDSSWSDPYSLRSVDQLQSGYAALRHDSWIYTPEAVVDGGLQFVGSDTHAMAAAIARAKARIATEPLISAAVAGAGQELTITIGSGPGTGTVWLFGFEPAHSTRVRGGENACATVGEVNVVRSITRLADWQGRSLQLRAGRPAGTRFAVILQRADGTIAAAAST